MTTKEKKKLFAALGKSGGKKRWAKRTKSERSAEMSRVSKARWGKRRDKK